MSDFVHPAEREAERLRVIIETLAHAKPDMTIYEAAPKIFEIEKKTAELEKVQVLPAPAGPGYYDGSVFYLPDSEPQTLAKFVEICPPIQAFLPHKKINAIKELRARTGVGLKEAKDGIEYFEAHGSVVVPAPPTPPVGSSSGRSFPTPLSVADWIETDPTAIHIRHILTTRATTHYKILAIKETRASTLLGLKEAKEGVEEWVKIYG